MLICNSFFNELQLTYPYEQTQVQETLTAREYARFFRLLYNATYLDEDLSEKALSLLSQSTYKRGLVAGVKKDLPVAHKFGLHTHINPAGEVIGRQLHDCGIIYDDDPYILCVMTKSNTVNLQDLEQVISSISKRIYEAHTSK